MCGAPGRIRTRGLVVRSHPLYPLSYRRPFHAQTERNGGNPTRHRHSAAWLLLASRSRPAPTSSGGGSEPVPTLGCHLLGPIRPCKGVVATALVPVGGGFVNLSGRSNPSLGWVGGCRLLLDCPGPDAGGLQPRRWHAVEQRAIERHPVDRPQRTAGRRGPGRHRLQSRSCSPHDQRRDGSGERQIHEAWDGIGLSKDGTTFFSPFRVPGPRRPTAPAGRSGRWVG